MARTIGTQSRQNRHSFWRRDARGWYREFAAIVMVLLASLPAVLPFTRFRYLESHDGTYHLLRLVEFDRLFRAGDFAPGWFPDFAVGYGYPLLSFYPPLAYYPAELLHLFGFGFVDAVKSALALGICFSAVGAYLFGRDVFRSRLAGCLVSVGFVYAPYHLIDAYVRAILSESWVFPFMPLLLWSLGRAAAGSRRHVGLAALWWAGLICAHNVIALFFTPAALLYGLVAVVDIGNARRGQEGKSARFALLDRNALPAFRRIGIAFALGLLLASAYWLPALVENRYVSTGNFATADYRPESHLNGFDELISDDRLHEYAQSPFRFGLAQAAFAIAGLGAFPWLGRARLVAYYGFALTIGFGSLLTPAMSWIWPTVPLIAYVQFPTRLLSIAALGTALLTGGLAQLPSPIRWFAAVATLSMIVSGVAKIDPPRLEPRDQDLTVGAIARFEYDSGIIGTTTAAEYLPVWARAGFVPPTEGFAQPGGTGQDAQLSAKLLSAGSTDFMLKTSAPIATPLRFHQFYFPGWSATIDGVAVEVRPSTELGLLTVDVPAGEHDVAVGYRQTVVRQTARAVSVVGLLTVMILIFGGLPGTALILGGALAVAGAATLATRSDSAAWVALNPGPADGQVALAGGRARAVAGGAEVELAWLATAEGPADRPAGLRLVRDGTTIETWSRPIYGTSPMAAWHRNEIVRDRREIRLPAGTPAGTYRIEVSLPRGGWQPVGDLGLGPGTSVFEQWSHEVGARFDQMIELVGYDLKATGVGERLAPPPAAAATLVSGDRVRLRLVWRALTDLERGYTVFVHLIGPDGRRVAQQDNQPGWGFWPTVLWQPNLLVDDEYELRVPDAALPGAYRIEVGLYWLADLERLGLDGTDKNALVLAQLKLAGPQQPVSAVAPLFGKTIALEEARLSGNKLDVVWRAKGAVDRDLTIFVHALDASGRLVDQRDGPPSDGAYPSSLWSVGEQIRERRDTPTLPPGGSLVIGIYDLKTGQRLQLDDGSDSVRIAGP